VPPPAGPTLTLLSFNVYEGRADPVALGAAIRGRGPDLVVLPEAGDRFQQRLSPMLAGLGYHSWSTVTADQPDQTGIVVFASARLGAVTARPLQLGTEFRWLRLSGDALGDTDVVAVRTAAPLPDLMPAWTAELGQLRQWCASGPYIVVGDVNATLDHAVLRAGTTGCTDAAADRGEELVATWPTKWPR
jgi:endonuclease/exonuclease/phosphatase (EEP) superfamily protein YafD